MAVFRTNIAVNMARLKQLRTVVDDDASARYDNEEISYVREVQDREINVRILGDFDLAGDAVIGGTIEALTVEIDGVEAYAFTGLNLGILPFIEQQNFYGSDGGVADLMAGNDDINGSKFDDLLLGFAGDDLINGGRGADRLVGGADSDTLDGGRGRDTLIGGGDVDWFLFSTPRGGNGGVDRIRDFDPALDNIMYERDINESAVAGDSALPKLMEATRFHVGRHATTEAHRFIYNPENGKLWYDADGRGGDDQVLVAKLVGAPSIDYANDPCIYMI